MCLGAHKESDFIPVEDTCLVTGYVILEGAICVTCLLAMPRLDHHMELAGRFTASLDLVPARSRVTASCYQCFPILGHHYRVVEASRDDLPPQARQHWYQAALWLVLDALHAQAWLPRAPTLLSMSKGRRMTVWALAPTTLPRFRTMCSPTSAS